MAITPAIVDVTTDAVLAAYTDYAGGTITPPLGYASASSSFYGWEGLDPASPAVAKKFALVFRSVQNPGEFLVAFRGTETADEWIANASFPTSPFPGSPGIDVEDGFLDVYSSSSGQNPPSLRDSLTTYLKSVTVTRLLVTGHSLGGALAALFAFDVATNLKMQPTVVTYACPNVGTASWATAFKAAVPDATRVYNTQDIVPYLPPTQMGYAPVGVESALEYRPQSLWYRVLPQALATNHSMDNYQYVTGHAYANNPAGWIGTFPDQSGDTSWTMQSIAPSAGGMALGLSMAMAHLDFLKKLKSIHGL